MKTHIRLFEEETGAGSGAGGTAAPTLPAGASESHSMWTDTGRQVQSEGESAETQPAKGAQATTSPAGTQPAAGAATQQTASATTTPPAQTALTPEQIANIAAQAAARVNPGQQQQKPSGPSDEELAKQLNVFSATEDTYEQIFGIKPDKPERVAALNNVLQAISKQSVTIAQAIVANEMARFNKSIDPYISAVRSQEAERQRTTFFTEHKDLVGYDAIVESVYNSVKQSGKTFSDVAAARKFVADESRKLLAAAKVNLGGGTQSGAQTSTGSAAPNPPARRQMSPTSVGGRGGGSSATGQKPANNIAAVWGDK